MITVVTERNEQTVSGSPAMVAKLIPSARTVLGELSSAERMRAAEPGRHPWQVRVAAA